MIKRFFNRFIGEEYDSVSKEEQYKRIRNKEHQGKSFSPALVFFIFCLSCAYASRSLSANFACYTDSPDDARNLLTVEMADRLVVIYYLHRS